MGLFDGMRKRQKARQKRRSGRQSARQTRKQTRTELRNTPEAIAGRQGMITDLGGKAIQAAGSIVGGMLGQDSAMAAYTDTEPMGSTGYVAMDVDDGGIDPMLIGIGALAVVGVLFMVMKK